MTFSWFGKSEKDAKDKDASKDVKEAKVEKKEVKKPDFSKLKDSPWSLKDVHVHALGQYYLDLYPEKNYSHSKQAEATECLKYNNPQGSALERWRFLVDQYAKVFGSRNFSQDFIELFKLSFAELKDESFKGDKALVVSNLKLVVAEHFLKVYKNLYEREKKDPNRKFAADANSVALQEAAKASVPQAQVSESARVVQSPKA
jgi:hypothetical protein